jgi:hypothetical protein
MEAYGKTKCRIFSRMETSDVAVIPQRNYPPLTNPLKFVLIYFALPLCY